MTSDGCTAGPLSGYLNSFAYACCAQHDVDYSNVARAPDKLAADWHLFTCVMGTGRPIWAAIIFLAVTAFGWFFIRRR